ncbi:MAG: sugar phosphate isomerase/epimerase [Chloroflexota bacterium]|nr:MAG: sugar phosphate isomerase/epimerase [Chloroflexota bacterium]
MTAPIALQLYTVRDLLKHDFEGVIRRVAGIGYAGVETAGLPEGVSATEAAALFADCDLVVAAGHFPLPLGDDEQTVLETARQLGIQRIVSGYVPAEEYGDLASIKRVCARLNEAQSAAASAGLEFGVHNHWWEFQAAGDVYPYQVWLDELDPAILFELDTYWVQSAGADPVEMVELFGRRAPLLHVKDGPAGPDTDASMTAVGDGRLDYPSIVAAADPFAEWLIVELDRCATDMMTAVERSYHYLVGEGLAHGR